VTAVLVSAAYGRPYGARKALGYTHTWAAWWKSDPRIWSRDGGEFPPPDAWGGARSDEDVPSIVRELATRFGKLGDFEIELIGATLCQSWRWIQRGHSPSEDVRAEQKRVWDNWWRAFENTCRRSTERPGAHSGAPECLAALGLDAKATEADVNRAFRIRARDLHPDRGGDEIAFKQLNSNYVEALKIVRARVQFAGGAL
jgi:hypothetical protein